MFEEGREAGSLGSPHPLGNPAPPSRPTRLAPPFGRRFGTFPISRIGLAELRFGVYDGPKICEWGLDDGAERRAPGFVVGARRVFPLDYDSGRRLPRAWPGVRSPAGGTAA